MDKLLKKEKNLNSICHSCVSENPAGNKVLHTAGSSGLSRGSILPLKNKGRLRGGFDLFKTHPTFPYALREGQIGRSTPSLSLRGGFANEAISCRLPRPIGLAMTGYKKCGLAMMEQRGHSTPARHPWTSVSEIRGSTWCSFNAPRYAQYAQSGRSMIEMLGVLAVIGVLSVAGIAGYNNAMNRHRANELLYEVQKRAVVVAAQVAQGRESLSISEFTNPSGYLFDVKNWNTTQFAVTLTQDDGANIDAKICDQIKMLTENNLFFQRIGKNCIHFIFNKNLSSADEPTLKKSCTKQSECNGYQQCLNGYCEENCRSDQLFSEKDKTYDCSEIPTTCGICTERQYCKITAHNYIPDTGECVDLESEEEFESKKRTLIFPDGTTKSVWLNASVSISWWSAKNYCEAHGKKMADINTAMALEPKYWTWTSEISNYRGAYAVLERVAKGLERNYSYKALCID